jgi:hypothetical protein
MIEIVEALAEQLHKEYRAAFKALHSGRGSFMGVGRVVSKDATDCRSQHDHGWAHCHRQKYFRRRAERWLAAERAEVLRHYRTLGMTLKDPCFETPYENT